MIPARLRCRPDHRACSLAHAQFVRDYQDARDVQDRLIEQRTGLYPGDLADARARGMTRTQLRDFMIANRVE